MTATNARLTTTMGKLRRTWLYKTEYAYEIDSLASAIPNLRNSNSPFLFELVLDNLGIVSTTMTLGVFPSWLIERYKWHCADHVKEFRDMSTCANALDAMYYTSIQKRPGAYSTRPLSDFIPWLQSEDEAVKERLRRSTNGYFDTRDAMGIKAIRELIAEPWETVATLQSIARYKAWCDMWEVGEENRRSAWGFGHDVCGWHTQDDFDAAVRKERAWQAEELLRMCRREGWYADNFFDHLPQNDETQCIL